TRSGGSGTRHRRAAAHAAASDSGCRRSGSRRDRAPLEGASVLEEVVVELELLVLLGIRRSLGATDLEVLRRQPGAQGVHQDLVSLQLVERLLRGRREAPNATVVPLLVGQVAGVLPDR